MSDFKPGDKKYCTPMCVNVCDELRLTGLVTKRAIALKSYRCVRPEIPMSIIYNIIDGGISVF